MQPYSMTTLTLDFLLPRLFGKQRQANYNSDESVGPPSIRLLNSFFRRDYNYPLSPGPIPGPRDISL